MLTWFILAYILIAIIVGYRNRHESYESDAFWLGLGWPLFALLYVFMFLLDLVGFRIH